nr:MAG TPA: hypothetical protein [Caudoviricetes sp.]
MPQWVRGGGVSLVMIGFNSLLSLCIFLSSMRLFLG